MEADPVAQKLPDRTFSVAVVAARRNELEVERKHSKSEDRRAIGLAAASKGDTPLAFWS
jgi:hypothetical protein